LAHKQKSRLSCIQPPCSNLLLQLQSAQHI
jgi:hypothetical protein